MPPNQDTSTDIRRRRFSPAAIWEGLRWRFRAAVRRGDLTALLITCGLLAIPALALNSILNVQSSARYWPVGLDQLVIVGVASVIFGYLLARSHYGELLSLLVTGVYAVATIGILQILLAPGDLFQRIVEVTERFLDSISQIQQGSAGDPFLLVLFLSFLFWFLGHNTAWHVFRIDRIWRAVIPPAIVLVINGLYNFGSTSLDIFLLLYLFLALMLVVRSHLNGREYDWYAHRITFDRKLRARMYQAGALASVAIMVVAWTLPTGSPEQNQQRFQDFINGDLLTQLNKLLSRLTTPLDTISSSASDYYGRDTLQLGGAVQLGDQPVLTVQITQGAPPNARYYWRSRVFDTFKDNTWSSTGSQEVSAVNLPQPTYDPSTRQNVNQTFTIQNVPSQLVYAAPDASQVTVAAQARVNVVDGAFDVMVIHPEQTLEPGASYSAVSAISVATADQLRVASKQYPAWIAPDLIIDPNTAPQTQQAAAQIVTAANAFTEYDKAKAIESWLRTHIMYNATMPQPPSDPKADLVDWAVFGVKQGYCTYYASAMVVMLRKLGIPARMAAGFAQGIYDPSTNEYVVRERDAHTWVEVYFPGAGWVEFEPTAAQPALNRADSRAAPPTNTPTPTPTPTFTFMPPPQPTSTQQTPGQNVIPPTATAIPPTVTPQATPQTTPPPTFLSLPPLPPQLGSLIALALIGASLIGVVSFILVGLLWWVEYRGLGHLTPIARAYARLAIYARWLRVSTPPGATPLEKGRRLIREVPEQSPAITAITDLYINERYAPPHPQTPAEEDRANAAWRLARGGLIEHWLQRRFRRNKKNP